MARPRVHWMNQGPDDRILDVLAISPYPLTPKAIAYELDFDYDDQYIRERLSVLRRHGLVEYPQDLPDDVSPKGLYLITRLGQKYVDGEAEKHELE